MKTIEELVYYCKESEPVGALLLSGEWGCGKTYLIDHDLKDALIDTAVILRISLFGMTSPEEIHAAIRHRWIEEYCKIKGVGGITQKIGRGRKWLAKVDFLPEWLKGIATTDISVFFPIGKKMEGKTVVLVFDDLERCRMSNVDVFGVINDYLENHSYHTIVVANQAKIKARQEVTQLTGEIQSVSSGNNASKTGENKASIKVDIPIQTMQGELSYTEIKEKIVQRTIQYLPNYKEIVHAIIVSLKYEDDCYKEFIIGCEEGLLELFAPDRHDLKCEQTQYDNKEQSRSAPPHNIRSLKCAIKDFYRVYNILRSYGFTNLDNWLYSFTSYIIAYKADIAKEDSYGTLFSDDEVRKLYPAFQSKYTLNGVKHWILHGIWNETAIKNEIEMIRQRNAAQSAPEIIKSNRIMNIDDAIIHDGFADFLNIAYGGGLTLDEYVLLIENSCWARLYKYEFPVSIDWKRLKEGILFRIDEIKKMLPDGQILFSVIGTEQRPHFTDEEWSAYELIASFALGDELIFCKNRKLYIDKMCELGTSAYTFIQNKRYDTFNEEMAIATVRAFERENNAGKNQFISDFKQIWTRNIKSPDLRLEDSIKGFEILKTHLNKALSKEPQEKRTFSTIHTEQFVAVLSELINDIKSTIPGASEPQNS